LKGIGAGAWQLRGAGRVWQMLKEQMLGWRRSGAGTPFIIHAPTWASFVSPLDGLAPSDLHGLRTAREVVLSFGVTCDAARRAVLHRRREGFSTIFYAGPISPGNHTLGRSVATISRPRLWRVRLPVDVHVHSEPGITRRCTAGGNAMIAERSSWQGRHEAVSRTTSGLEEARGWSTGKG